MDAVLEKLVPYLDNGFALIAFLAVLFFGIHKLLIKSGLITPVTRGESAAILKLILIYGFTLLLVVAIAVPIYLAWEKYLTSDVRIHEIRESAKREAEALFKKELKLRQAEWERASSEQLSVMQKVLETLVVQGSMPKADSQQRDIAAKVRENGVESAIPLLESQIKNSNSKTAQLAMQLGAITALNSPTKAVAAYLRSVQADPTNAEAWLQLGILNWQMGKYGEATKALEQASLLARKSGDQRTLAQSLTNRGIVARKTAHPDEAGRYHDDAQSIFEAIQDAEGQAANLISAALLESMQNQWDKSEDLVIRAIDIAEAGGFKRQLAKAYNNLGHLYYHRDQLQEALHNYDLALALNQELKRSRGILLNLMNMGSIHVALGNLDDAKHLYEESLRLAESRSSREEYVMAYANLGALYHKMGDRQKAEHFTSSAIRMAKENQITQVLAGGYENLGRIKAEGGDFSAAKSALLSCIRIAGKRTDRQQISFCRLELGNTARLSKKFDEAKLQIQQGLTTAQAVKCRPAVALAHKYFGLVHFDLGDRNRSASEFKIAHDLFKKSGHLFEANAVNRLIATLNALPRNQ